MRYIQLFVEEASTLLYALEYSDKALVVTRSNELLWMSKTRLPETMRYLVPSFAQPENEESMKVSLRSRLRAIVAKGSGRLEMSISETRIILYGLNAWKSTLELSQGRTRYPIDRPVTEALRCEKLKRKIERLQGRLGLEHTGWY